MFHEVAVRARLALKTLTLILMVRVRVRVISSCDFPCNMRTGVRIKLQIVMCFFLSTKLRSSIIIRYSIHRSYVQTIILNGFLCITLGFFEVMAFLFICRLFIILSHRIIVTVFTPVIVRYVIATWCSFVLFYYVDCTGNETSQQLVNVQA